MKKTIVLLAAAAVAVIVLAKVTNVGSYVGTLWMQAKAAAKQQVPTKFEIDRIRHDIATLDQELDRMVGPIAEHKVAVDRLRRKITEDEVKLNDQKKVLLDATALVKGAKKNDKLRYGDRDYTVAQVTAKIAIDFGAFKRFEANVAAQRKLLEAKEATLVAAQEQLQTFISKKQEFAVQLAQLEAEYEVNQVAAIGTDIKVDNSRLAAIGESLNNLRDTIDQQRIALETMRGIREANGIPLNQPQQSVAVDLDAIQAHLENGPPAKTTTTASK